MNLAATFKEWLMQPGNFGDARNGDKGVTKEQG
jgi:hypothetical protein